MSERGKERSATISADRMPVAFVPHGGGPWPFVDLGLDDPAGFEALATYLRSVPKLPKRPPKALLVISAHWEEPVPTEPGQLQINHAFESLSYNQTASIAWRILRWGAGGPPLSGHVPISMWDVDVLSAAFRSDFIMFRKIRRKHPTLISAALFFGGGARPSRALPPPSQLAARGRLMPRWRGGSGSPGAGATLESITIHLVESPQRSIA